MTKRRQAVALQRINPLVPACLRRSSRFRCVVELPRLHNKFLIVVRAVAINVYLHNELVLLPVLYVARVKSKTVLAAQQGVDAA